MIHYLDPRYPANRALLVTPGYGAAYIVLDADGERVARFDTDGVNGKTPDDTAIGNLADLSDYLPGPLRLFRLGAFHGSTLLAQAEWGCITLARPRGAEG